MVDQNINVVLIKMVLYSYHLVSNKSAQKLIKVVVRDPWLGVFAVTRVLPRAKNIAAFFIIW